MLLVLATVDLGLFFTGAFRPYDYGMAYGGLVLASIAGAAVLGFLTSNRWAQIAFVALGFMLIWLLVIAEHVSSEGNPDHRLDWIPWLHVVGSISIFAALSMRAGRSR